MVSPELAAGVEYGVPGTRWCPRNSSNDQSLGIEYGVPGTMGSSVLLVPGGPIITMSGSPALSLTEQRRTSRECFDQVDVQS